MGPFDDLLSGVYSSTVTEASVLVREVRVKIGVLPTAVAIRIYYDGRRAEPYLFETSKRMKPSAVSERDRGACAAASEQEALRRAVRMLTEDYEEAVRRGQLPDESWLVASDFEAAANG